MNYYLLKTEPTEYSFDDLLREKTAVWSGVSSAPALLQLRSMKKGDRTFIYHTGKEKQIVGIAAIVSAPYADPNADDPKLVVVDIRAEERLRHPVTLDAVKRTTALAAMPLVKQGRLSVQPVTKVQWELILSLSRG